MNSIKILLTASNGQMILQSSLEPAVKSWAEKHEMEVTPKVIRATAYTLRAMMMQMKNHKRNERNKRLVPTQYRQKFPPQLYHNLILVSSVAQKSSVKIELIIMINNDAKYSCTLRLQTTYDLIDVEAAKAKKRTMMTSDEESASEASEGTVAGLLNDASPTLDALLNKSDFSSEVCAVLRSTKSKNENK